MNFDDYIFVALCCIGLGLLIYISLTLQKITKILDKND